MSNKVTIYSNGVADYQRTLKVGQDGQEVRIPVRQSDLDDVLGSLGVFGDVEYTPPTFSPSNSKDGTLELEAHDIYGQFAEKLRRAKATVSVHDGPDVSGLIVGLNSEPEVNDGESVERRSMVLSVDGGYQSVRLKDVRSVVFSDEQVQSEIDKALHRAFQKIKPESTFVTTQIKAKQDQEVDATVQYITSAAAWKLAYRLRALGGQYRFEGFAVVDNNTEEDWTDANISVVVGEPVSFKTDLAQVRPVLRNTVNIVQSQAQGVVEAEEAMMMANLNYSNAAPPNRNTRGYAKSMAQGGPQFAAMSAACDAESFGALESAPPGGGYVAEVNQAEVKEVGDYCIFQSTQPVTIASKRSAMVPVFQHVLEETDLVLYYKPSQRADRAFRSIRFTNQTEHSLGRGACSIYNDGAFAGQCVIPATQVNQKQLLPHALETGVLIRRTNKSPQQNVTAVRVEKGVAYLESSASQTTLYQLKNNKSEKFTIVVDHDKKIRGATRYATVQVLGKGNAENGEKKTVSDVEKLENGVRYTVSLQENQEVLLVVTEEKVNKQEVVFSDNHNLSWFMTHVAALGGEFKNNEVIQSCIDIQSKIDEKEFEAEKAQTEASNLEGKQDRLRKNLGATESGEQVKKWQGELALAEDRLTEIYEKTIPQLEEEQESLHRDLREALKQISGSWKS